MSARSFRSTSNVLWRYSDVLKQMAFLQRLDRMWRVTLSDRYHVAAMYNDYMLLTGAVATSAVVEHEIGENQDL